MFFGHCTDKVKTMLWNFVWLLLAYRFIANFPFFRYFHRFGIYSMFSWEKWKLFFLWVKSHISKTSRRPDCKTLDFTFFWYVLSFTCDLHIPWDLEIYCFFFTQMMKHGVTKTIFSRKVLHILSWMFDGRRQVDAE